MTTPADRERLVERLRERANAMMAWSVGLPADAELMRQAAALIERLQNAPPREPDEGMKRSGRAVLNSYNIRDLDDMTTKVWHSMFDAWQRSRGDV